MLVARRIANRPLKKAEADDEAAKPTHPGDHPPARRAYVIVPGIALLMLGFTLLIGGQYGLGLRDPDGVVGSRLLLLVAAIGIFWALDVVPRAVRSGRNGHNGLRERIVYMAGKRWSWRRLAVVVGSIAAFYLTYLCYRNVKSYVPLLRPELHDQDLLSFERGVFGNDPAVILHDILGTGIAAHVLSTVYLLFLAFVPVSLGIALVWSTRTSVGLWWVSALSLNWVFGAVSYFLVPSLGPAYAAPQLFTSLPDTGVSALHQALLDDRNVFLASPIQSGGLQSIAAFASLHVAIVFTGALMAHVLRAPRMLRYVMWTFLVLTILATIYFGWHYVVDDIAGFVIGGLSVYLSALLTGWRIDSERPRRGLQTQEA
jgi:membrane-associated phospholipid phosphatase